MSRTTAHTGLALLVLLMMATQFRRVANAQASTVEPGWAWIAGGHLLYFLATLTGRSLLEALVARSRSAVGVASAALFVAYALAMVAIAWGIWASAREPANREPADPGVAEGARPAGPARAPLPTA
jgi:ABC-type antimicrobial peptide transport system permease subunit